ncbi:MAG: porin [Dechloromonas sp.]|uniref:Porin n=1 Tax=Candidatus Dechloromonas phosphorivorans TaxID=2899244 RepID=A0A9D7LKE0_9RHOO|nr:porin [Candidatus Dechloromonas phosphorivorans]
MQKKLIALAVAGLASTAAFAQTNVTIYGSVDYGYTYRFDARGVDSLTNGGRNFNKPGSASQLNGGQLNGNRLGFKGTEDLGNGLKAVFLFEQGWQGDTGAAASSTSTFNRQAYVGLSGNFGTVVGGRLYTPHYTFVSGLDPFGAGMMGSYRNVYSPVGSVTGDNLMDPVRVNNALAYMSPSWGGFQLTAAFSNNAFSADSTNNNALNNTVYAVLGQYTGGMFTVGANYHYIAGGTQTGSSLITGPLYTLTAGRLDSVQNFTLGGSVDFKVAKVMALYSWNEVDINAANVGNGTINNYMLGATFPFGKNEVLASYIYSDGNRQVGGDAQQLALGYKYNFSKRTSFYRAYSWIDNSSKRLNGVGDATATGSYDAQTNAGGVATFQPAGVWQQAVQVGLRHWF